MKAIVTGAASGIGRAIAQRLAADWAEQGLLLVLLDRSAAPLATLAEELNNIDGVDVFGLPADLSAPEELAQAVSTALDRCDAEVDLLVNNAGISAPGNLRDLSLEAWDLDFAVNTRAAFLLSQACYRALARRRGSIVMTGSLSGSEPSPGLGAYSASKAATIMLVKLLAREWGPVGIRVNSVSPGSVLTGMTKRTYADVEFADRRAAAIPLGRVAEPEDIAAAVVMLAGADARYISGVDVRVDGGWGVALMPQAAAAPRA
ncbi:SDR family NAD(P)-dependent oxidoreductase [Agrococcus baldri]|uniref:L-xylulose reductase n=1 Tax=Agrococcus baldri TaxID=153730 RepID=A0AA87RHL6_9MICO|nr:SDR family oxidoreductase [Agrococcus baldri]GEK79643.1 L-xylulose reductase [Agrococcus baldri]